MIVPGRFVICTVCLLVTFCFSHLVSGAELIGIMPFSNQRYQEQDNWLGYYIQARIQANLLNNSDWQFHTQHALSLWTLRLDRSLPISPQTTIQIEGSFQRVAGLGYISLRIECPNSNEKRQSEFEKSFDSKDLDTSIDELSIQVGQWIDPGFRYTRQVTFPVYKSDITRTLFKVRSKMFEPNADMPDIRSILYLEDKINENSPYPMICDLAEAMLIHSQLLNNREQKMVYNRIEHLLRKAILKHRKQACLHVLLAEVYYLSGSYATWVEKTADDGIRFGDLSGIGYLLKEIVKDEETSIDAKYLNNIKHFNPWLLAIKINSAEIFQKGLLKEELLQLKAAEFGTEKKHNSQ